MSNVVERVVKAEENIGISILFGAGWCIFRCQALWVETRHLASRNYLSAMACPATREGKEAMFANCDSDSKSSLVTGLSRV
jgi:hypothetical protein